MKIIDWFKNLINKITKKDYLLEEGNKEQVTKSKINTKNKDWIQRIDLTRQKQKRTREDIIRGLRDDIIVEDLSEELNYDKFSEEKIRSKYDPENLLSENDLTAIECLYGAIEYGNKEVYPHFDRNKINLFLKENPNNIVTVVNLVIKDAENLYKSLDKKTADTVTVNGLITGSYDEIVELIECYKEQEQAQGIE